MKKYHVQDLVFNSFAGLYESYLCQAYNTGEEILLQSLPLNPNEARFAQEKILQLMSLDPSRIETFDHAYHSNNHIYIANKYIN